MLKLDKACKCIAFVVMALALLCQPAYGKIKVTKKVSSSGLNHLSIFGKGGASYHLFCDGYNTEITVDSKGKTHVYVNDDGGTYKTESKYEVDLSEFPEIDWSDVAIYGGKDGDNETCAQANIWLNGGQVGQIYLGGRGKNNKVTGTANLWIYGGTVEYIGASSSSDFCTFGGYEKIYMKDLNYTGFTKMGLSGNESKTTVYIAPSCRFFYENARITESDVANLQGALYYNYDYTGRVTLYAKGSLIVPSTIPLECDYFIDNSTSFSLESRMTIRTCGGWYSTKDIADSKYAGKITIPAHQHEQYIIYPATCTEDADYYSACSVCGKNIPTTLNVTKLGHTKLRVAGYSSTCFRNGYSYRTYCSRCGETIGKPTKLALADHDFDTVTYSSKDKRIPRCIRITKTTESGATIKNPKVTIRFCKTCGFFEVIGGQGSCYHNTYANNLSEGGNGVSVLAAADCYTTGWITAKCSFCDHTIGRETPKKNHSFVVSQEEIKPTCTGSGYKKTYKCTLCQGLFLTDEDVTDQNPVAAKYQKIPALGHKYNTYTPNPITHTLVKEATCTEPAMYKERCERCNAENDTMFVSVKDDRLLGHSYYLRKMTYASQANPEEGYVELGCEHCSHTIKYFPFFACRTLGEMGQTGFVPGKYGYWCKSKLIETTKLPTCVDGEGKYEMSICYGGKIMRGTYTSRVRPCGYLHNFHDVGGIGKCTEKHYEYFYDNVTGKIRKGGMGELNFATQNVSNNVLIQDLQPIVDNTVYTAKAYIAVPVQVQASGPSGLPGREMPYYDPEDGTPYCYTDYDVTTYSTLSAFNTAIAQQTRPFYAGTFGSYSLASYPNILTNPYYIALDTHGGALNYTLNDAVKYEGGTEFGLSSLSYNRDFANTNWQPLYVPFPVSVSTLESKGLQVARLNDTHMFDDDFNGTIDRATLEFIRITSGTLQPNRPYMVRSTSKNNSVSLTLNQVKLAPAIEASVECSTVDQKITITGTYKGLTGKEMVTNNYYAMNTTEGLQRAKTSTNDILVKPQRWYMKFENKDGSPIQESDYLSAEIRVLGDWDDDEMTGSSAIDDMTSDSVEGEQPVYSLDGMRVSGNQTLKKGIYVENGKRIIIR